MKSWVEFWDGAHAIYVNDRHKQLHARAVARDIVRQIPSPDAAVLDHGCGEALYAAEVAARCGSLMLCEAAPGLREALAQRVAGVANITVLDPAGVAALPAGSLDLIVANSLVQYLKRDELTALLGLWRGKLKATGALVVADVIPPQVSPVTDALALLRFGWAGGFFLAALGGLVRTALSDYGKVRMQLGLATYSDSDIRVLLEAAGFKTQRLQANFGHNQGRMAFRATLA